MKRVFIGGFLSIVGSIWTLAFMFIAGNNLVPSWPTPPGRFLTTMSELNLMFPFVLAILLVVLGIAIMVVEFFKKEK